MSKKRHMRNTYIYAATLFFISLTACKKEVSQKDAVQKITFLASQKKISKQHFLQELMPIVNDLYEKDREKYRIIHHIALKAQNEKNSEIFQLQVKNLKDEMQFIK